ncbi:MAG: AzlC family ABC transporter permease, partial [Cellulosimicrobium funkei]
PRAWGLDAAAAAAFLGLLWPRLATRAMQLTAAAAVVVAAALVPVAPGGVPVLAAAAVAVVIGQVDARRRRAADRAGTAAGPRGEEPS